MDNVSLEKRLPDRVNYDVDILRLNLKRAARLKNRARIRTLYRVHDFVLKYKSVCSTFP